MKVFGMCINLKVVVGLAVAGAAVWTVAPGALAAALPLLAILVCPLSMLVMMRAMKGGAGSRDESSGAPADAAAGHAAVLADADGERRADVAAAPAQPAMAQRGAR